MRLLKAFKHLGRFREVVNCVCRTSQWSDLVLAYLGIKKMKFPFEFVTRSGHRLTINTFNDLVTIWVIFFREEYKVDSNCKLIIDAGANIGSFTIFAAIEAPDARIISLEPFPETYEMFNKNIALNNLGSRVKLVTMALAQNVGTARMDDSTEEFVCQSRGFVEGEQGGLEVSTMTLESLFEAESIGEVDLMKMDIEGAEHQVLPFVSSEILARIKKFSMEYHPNGSRQQLFDLLEREGLKLVLDRRNSENSGVAWFSR